MSLDRPGRAVTSGTKSSPRCPVRASANPGAPARLPQQDTTGEAGYVAGTGPQRRAGPGFSSVRAVVRLLTAGGHGRPVAA